MRADRHRPRASRMVLEELERTRDVIWSRRPGTNAANAGVFQPSRGARCMIVSAVDDHHPVVP
ncbi:hypothetical protein [Sorangium sp. So ce1024]|uniref:hypothetical protein n=1 Tax=Sorangium sp. So ce1024 TaxID=3133327 RepID=UPI003F054F63